MATVFENSLSFAKRLGRLVSGRATELSSASQDNGELPELFAMVREAYNEHNEDRIDTQRLRDFYEGNSLTGSGLNHGKQYITAWPDEPESDLEKRLKRMESTKWNRLREGVNAHADALYAWGRGRAVNRSIQFDNDSGVSDADREWFDQYYHRRFTVRNGFKHFMWDTWRTVGSERHALIMNMWMDGSLRRLRRFGSRPGRTVMRDRGVVWLERLDNLQCIPIPHPLQTRTLGTVIRWYERPLSTRGTSRTVPHPGHPETVTELITDDLWIRWVGTKVERHEWGVTNRYRDVRSMFTWVRNPADYADSEDAIGPQNLLNEHLYNAREISREHAFPETLYRGFSPPTRDVDGQRMLIRAPNVAYQSDEPNADIIKKGAEASFQDVGLREDQVHQMLDGALGLSITDRGSGKDLGQLRSGPAMSRLQSRSERRRARKMMCAMDAEQELFESVRNVTIYHALGPDKVGEWFSSRMVVTFPEDAFTQDPFTEAQTDQIEVSTGMAARIDKLRKRFPDLTDEELEEKAESIKDEQIEIATAGQEPGGDLNAPDPTPAARSTAQTAT